MPGQISVVFKLVGPNAGKTINLDHKSFVNGHYVTWIAHQHYEGLVGKLGRGYNAWPLGSIELMQAEAEWEKRNGRPVRVSAPTGQDVAPSVPSDGLRVEPERHAEAPASSGGRDECPAGELQGSEGDPVHGGVDERSTGSGLSDGLLSDGPRSSASEPDPQLIRNVIDSLDPEIDTHWASRGKNVGKPSLEAIAKATGIEGLSRADVEAAKPGWTRDKARVEAV